MIHFKCILHLCELKVIRLLVFINELFSISGESSLNEYDSEKFWDKSEEDESKKGVEFEQQKKTKRPRYRSTTSSKGPYFNVT